LAFTNYVLMWQDLFMAERRWGWGHRWIFVEGWGYVC